MERDELRLELLKLTYSHGRDAAEAVRRAKELERYISATNPESSEKLKKPGKSEALKDPA